MGAKTVTSADTVTSYWNRWYARYALAAGAMLVAMLLRHALVPVIGADTLYIVLYPATFVVAVTLGAGPGVFAAVLGVVSVEVFLVEPVGQLKWSLSMVVRGAIVLLASFYVGRVSQHMRASRAAALHLMQDAVEARRQAERLNAALEREAAEREQTEELLRVRMRLMEFAATHSLEEVLQETLNEVEKITDSAIGFYHFVEADQQTLSLQTWSTRTLREFCTAQGRGLHYSVSDAGVWVECVHRRRAVVHNDYASLPNRKGLPEGHARVVRELVVPILRRGRIVAILGVGNKPSDYTEKDVELVSYLADVAWETAERKRAEEALRESEESLKRAQEIAHLGSWEFDLVKNELIWSDEVYRIFGLQPQEFGATYEAFLEAVHPDDRSAVDTAYGGSVREGRDTYEIDHRVVRRNTGEVRWVHEKCVHAKDAAGAIVRSDGMVLDITERRRAEEALRRSNENLEQFAYVASHDLQEPLRIMASFSQLLEKRYKARLDSDADEFIGYIVDAANRMQRLISDLLAYSRIGRADAPVEEIDCNAVVAKVVRAMGPAIEKADAAVEYDGLPRLRANEGALLRLFQNLIGNAVKFRRDEPPRIRIDAARQGSEWLFSVRDNGIGFDEKYKDRVFAVFQRLHGKDHYPGTGIGLSICKKIVETHGGRIWVESQPGKGSTFRFTFPGKMAKETQNE